jgi:hypothetical protein
MSLETALLGSRLCFVRATCCSVFYFYVPGPDGRLLGLLRSIGTRMIGLAPSLIYYPEHFYLASYLREVVD